jgi:site-specific DNA recombinase
MQHLISSEEFSRDYLNGKGFDRIARELTNEGIPTPAQISGKKNANSLWQGSTVRVILTNPHYTGDLVQCRTTTSSVTSKVRVQNAPSMYVLVPDNHEAIIPRRDFDLVQKLIESRKRIKPQEEKHLFTNTCFCADCGRGMHYKENSKGYICGNYNKFVVQDLL